MLIEKMAVGPLMTNCYIIASGTGEDCLVIDPAADADRILDTCSRSGLKITGILLTHAHYDHIGAAGELSAKTGAAIYLHSYDKKILADPRKNLSFWFDLPEEFDLKIKEIGDKEMIRIGELEAEVLHTPGHTPGSVSLLAEKSLFSGDLLFAGSVGRTDFPESSQVKLIDSLKRKIMPLSDEITVYPGHGPETVLGSEKKSNPYLVKG